MRPPRQRRDDDGEEQKAETNGKAGLESEEESSAAFVDAPSAENGGEEISTATTMTDLTGFDTDGDALHLRYSSILRGALSPSPSKEGEEGDEKVEGAE